MHIGGEGRQPESDIDKTVKRNKSIYIINK